LPARSDNCGPERNMARVDEMNVHALSQLPVPNRAKTSIRRRSAMGVLSDLTGEGRPFSKAAFDGW
jgi:hypothetical protein